MSGDDGNPDYLKGVDQPGFDERDNFTVKTSEQGPLSRKGYNKYAEDDDDDDDITDETEPFRIPWVLILIVVIVLGALASLGIAGVAATGTWIGDQERASLVEAGKLAKVVVEEQKIIDQLGSRGADREKLLQLYSAIDAVDGHDKGLAALVYTHRIDEEVASIGDIRGSQVEDRHKKLAIAQASYEESLRSWDTAANNPVGAIAVMFGLADAPPVK